MSTPQLAILFFVVPNGVFVDQKTSRCKNIKCLSCQFWFEALEEEKIINQHDRKQKVQMTRAAKKPYKALMRKFTF